MEIIKLNINKIKFSFPIQNKIAKLCLAPLGGYFLHFEYVMERLSLLPEIMENNLLTIKKAHECDVELIAKLDSFCFKSDYLLMLQRYKDTFFDSNRQIWLANLGDDCIGKGHVHFEKETAFIHDVCIIPEQQRNGHGTTLLKFIVNQLINVGVCYKMHLEVAAEMNLLCSFIKNVVLKLRMLMSIGVLILISIAINDQVAIHQYKFTGLYLM